MTTRSARGDDRRGAEAKIGVDPIGRASIVVPLIVLAVAVVGLTLFCRAMLCGAADGQPIGSGELSLYVAAGCFLLAAGAVVVIQSVRVAQRVAGPEHRLILSLQRIRTGDLSFRVHLRKGDLLGDLAAECNTLLDWLNANPPHGARTGSDLVDIVDADEPAAAEVRA